MDFLRACARDLDAGVSSAEVLARMRQRYTTARSMSVKTCEVRALCTPTPEYVTARDALLLRARGTADHARLAAALAHPGKSVSADVRTLLQTLPPRLPSNSYALRLGRADVKQIKREAARSCVQKNRHKRRVQGRTLLALARARIASPHAHSVADLALAWMLVTGRRTCETLNGRNVVRVAGPYAIHFEGQAKRRDGAADDDDDDCSEASTMLDDDDEPDEAYSYVVPTLAPAEDVVAALDVLRGKQGHVRLSHRHASRRYQPILSRTLHADALWSSAGKVHGLRGVYACMAVRLFDWGDASDAFVAMNILGHRGLIESLVYTPFALGEEFGDEPHLGSGTPLPEEDKE